MTTRQVVAATTLLLVALLSTGAPSAAQQPGPTLVPDPASVVPGQEVRLHGGGWPASKLVTLEVCGNAGRGGSVHCDPGSSRTTPTDPEGSLSARFELAAPPSPCPCVIRAYIVGSTVEQHAPLIIDGVPFAEPTPEEAGDVESPLVVKASLRDSGGWSTWFGARPTRELLVRIENTGDHAVSWIPLDLAWGRETSPGGAIDIPEIGPIAPGETLDVAVPVELDVLAFGNYVVRGEIIGHPSTSFTARTSSYPYGLLAIPALLLLQVVLVRARDALARVVERRLYTPSHLATVSEPGDDSDYGLTVSLGDDRAPDVELDLTDAAPSDDEESACVAS